jgi:homoserine O-acetyltransferase
MIPKMNDTINWRNFQSHDYQIKDFKFDSGQTVSDLRLHYLTMGTSIHDSEGQLTNTALLLHNTTGTSQVWLKPNLGGKLFGPGQGLDLSQNVTI